MWSIIVVYSIVCNFTASYCIVLNTNVLNSTICNTSILPPKPITASAKDYFLLPSPVLGGIFDLVYMGPNISNGIFQSLIVAPKHWPDFYVKHINTKAKDAPDFTV